MDCTSLYWAIENGYERVASLLLRHASDLNALNPEQMHHIQRIQMLKELIEQEARKQEAHREMQPFLLANHPRLGAQSPAHALSRDLFREIFENLRNQNLRNQ